MKIALVRSTAHLFPARKPAFRRFPYRMVDLASVMQAGRWKTTAMPNAIWGRYSGGARRNGADSEGAGAREVICQHQNLV
jgi:hypothetical protein